MTSQEELAQHIQTQVRVVLRGEPIQTPSSGMVFGGCATHENVTEEMNNLYDRVERLIEPIAEKLALLEQPGHFPSHPASSCKEIIEAEPSSPSGYYWLRASNGSAVRMFCDMTRTCGGVTGGWMKVAELDMTDTTHQCPSSLSAHIQSGKRLCARKVNAAGCSSVNYPTQGIGYSEVCGKVIGYQYASTDGAAAYYFSSRSINGPYIDGVSLTNGNPRQHVWSFISAAGEDAQHSRSACYCTNRNSRGPLPPTFVGQDYFCDSGTHLWSDVYQFFDSPLWDGARCGSNSDCCTFHNPPWFYKNLAQGTRDDIEMRVCRDEASTNEDVYIEKVDIYVR